MDYQTIIVGIAGGTGSGKTRTVIELCHVFLDAGWVKNILFLADRTSLVIQAKRAFRNNYPDLSVTNLCEEKDNYNKALAELGNDVPIKKVNEVSTKHPIFFIKAPILPLPSH